MTRRLVLTVLALSMTVPVRAALPVTAPSTCPHYGLYEVRITHASGGYANVWENVAVTARFTPPSGPVVTVDGFFDSTNTWMVRFCPAQLGTYAWSVRLAGSITDSANGAFQSTASSERGFVRKHPTNPHRMVYEKDGGLYPAMGISACFGNNLNGSVDTVSVPFATYADYMFDSTGFNLFRVSISNCALKLWDTILVAGNRYQENEGRVCDYKLKICRQHGVRVMFDALGWMTRQSYSTNPTYYDALKRYWRYVVARYAAIVDIWELCNEASPADSWITTFAQYVKSIDPYGHMVSVSWERPAHADIDVNGPHLYQNGDPYFADQSMRQAIEPHRAYAKPIIYGEIGNATCNLINYNATQARCRSWTAFFREAALAWWEMNWTRAYCPGNGAANLFIGPEERQGFRCLQRYTAGVDAGAVIDSTWSYTSGSNFRVYELRSDSAAYFYIKNRSDFSRNNTDLNFTFTSPGAGTAYWHSTQTGDTLSRVAVGAGRQTLLAPPFVLDIALKVAGTGTTGAHGRRGPLVTRAGIRTTAGTHAFDLAGRWVPAQALADRTPGRVLLVSTTAARVVRKVCVAAR